MSLISRLLGGKISDRGVVAGNLGSGASSKASAPDTRFRLPWKKTAPLPREQVLRLRPIRNPVVTWESLEGQDKDNQDDDQDRTSEENPELFVLNIPMRQDRFTKILERIFGAPGGKKIQLDEFGSQVWSLCDGDHEVDDLVRFTCDNYKLNRRQGEVSVLAFMRMLSERRLIGYLKKEGNESYGSPKPRAKTGRQRRTTGRRARRH